MNKQNLFTKELMRFTHSLDIDFFGITSVDRLAHTSIYSILKPLNFLTKKNIIVIGIAFPDVSVERAGKAPAESATSYSFLQYQITYELTLALGEIADYLEARGYFSQPLLNFSPALSKVICPYSLFYNIGLPDIRGNSPVGVAAGLGELGLNGLLLTPQHGPRQRIAGVITDASLEQSPLYDGESLCDKCSLCIENCPVKALSPKTEEIKIGEKKFSVAIVNSPLCNREKRVGQTMEEWREEVLLSESPPKTTGSCGHTVIEKCLQVCLPPSLRLRMKDSDYSKVSLKRKVH
jgi:ferredoxin